MSIIKTIPVSHLKTKLLEIVREVERGQIYQITKGNRPVGVLSPFDVGAPAAVNFAQVSIQGDLSTTKTGEKWTMDIENVLGKNLAQKPRRKRMTSNQRTPRKSRETRKRR